jgi:hypothetical protein
MADAGQLVISYRVPSHLAASTAFEPFRVIVLQHDQTIVVAHVAGEVDMLTGPSLQSHLDEALASRVTEVL